MFLQYFKGFHATNGTKNSRMEQVKLVEDSLKFEGVWPDLARPYPFRSFKGYLPQILFGPFLNTLTQITVTNISNNTAKQYYRITQTNKFLIIAKKKKQFSRTDLLI